MARKNKLNGRFDSMSTVPEVENLKGTFSIKVKDDDGNVIYENDEESFDYVQVPSLQTALEHFGANLDDSQKQFLNEALSGDKSIGVAVKTLIDIINADLKSTAKSKAYAAIFNDKKPQSEESIKNARARMVRDFIRTSGGNISAETAIQVLNSSVWQSNPYTIEEFRENKGRV